MSIKLGFLGNGNMGYAILKGLVSSGQLQGEETAVYDLNDSVRRRAVELGANSFDNAIDLVANSEIILVAVKPQHSQALFNDIGNALKQKLLISIVAGYDVGYIKECLGNRAARVLRVMPNTPAIVQAGVFGLDVGSDASDDEKKLVTSWFTALGKTFWVEEKLFPAVTGLSGGGPAYAAIFIEALADAGVREGLTRQVALELAAQTVAGSAELILKENIHPAVLKDNVCSPAGTTIEGVLALESGSFRAAVIQAVEQATAKAKNLK